MPLNLDLLKNPVNWFVVTLTLFIGAFALHSFIPKTSDNS